MTCRSPQQSLDLLHSPASCPPCPPLSVLLLSPPSCPTSMAMGTRKMTMVCWLPTAMPPHRTPSRVQRRAGRGGEKAKRKE
eukprot:760464-Hanusia_phi.AAC.1